MNMTGIPLKNPQAGGTHYRKEDQEVGRGQGVQRKERGGRHRDTDTRCSKQERQLLHTQEET